MYQQLIIEHSKRPHGEGLRAPFGAQSHHVNPTCGDEITLRVRVDGGSVTDVSYDALGCSISRASASVLHDLVVGRSVPEVGDLRDAVQHMLTSRGEDPGDEEVLGDAVAFAGVAKYPARVKCALLSWSALADALLRTAPA
nr:SUF system NifU family Fe-S cluster assembly protein [Kineococcus aurantiacus]